MVAYPLRVLWDSSPFASPWISVGPYQVVMLGPGGHVEPGPNMTTKEASAIVFGSFACRCGSPPAALDQKEDAPK